MTDTHSKNVVYKPAGNYFQRHEPLKGLRKLRTERGFTQEVLATECGIMPHLISDYERGIVWPTLAVAKKLSQILHCTIEELIE